MTANITLGSAAVAADGKTVTATISGGTGTGYAITDKTGLLVFYNYDVGFITQPAFPISSVSVAGSTLTINLALPVGAGESPKLNITTSANLADSGSNTAQGQSSLAVTNNSTVTVAVYKPYSDGDKMELNSFFAPQGSAGNQFYNSGLGISYGDTPVEFVANCTDVGVLASSGLASSAIVDDAASASTLTADTSSGYNVKPAATGLVAADHLFRVNPGQLFYGIRVSGGTRALKSVATTKACLRTATATPANPYIANTTPVASLGAWKPSADAGGAYGDVLTLSYVGYACEFQMSGTGFEVSTVANGQWSAEIDGVQGTQLVTFSVTATDYVPVRAGLSTGTHTVRAVQVSCGVSGMQNRAVRVLNGTISTNLRSIGDSTIDVATTANLAVGDWCRIDSLSQREVRRIQSISGTTVTFASSFAKTHAVGAQVTSYSAPAGAITPWTKKTRTKLVLGVGDSNTQGWNEYGNTGTPDANGLYYVQYDPRQSAPFRGADGLSYDFINQGIQGNSTANLTSRTADLAAFARGGGYDAVLIWTGTNDINSTSITPGTYQSQVQTVVTAAKAQLKAGGRVLLIPPATPGSTNGGGLNLATCQSALQAIAAADPASVTYAPDIFTALITGDYNTLHFNEPGRVKIGAALQPYLLGTSTSVANSSAYLIA